MSARYICLYLTPEAQVLRYWLPESPAALTAAYRGSPFVALMDVVVRQEHARSSITRSPQDRSFVVPGGRATGRAQHVHVRTGQVARTELVADEGFLSCSIRSCRVRAGKVPKISCQKKLGRFNEESLRDDGIYCNWPGSSATSVYANKFDPLVLERAPPKFGI